MTSVDFNDIIDDQIETPKQQVQSRISPSSSQASLSKKIINNYKSQSLQSMNVLLNSGSISKESKNRSNNFKSSDHINQRSKKSDNFSINLVTSEEEADDDENDLNERQEVEISEQVEVINSSESRAVVVTKLHYENHHIEQINEALHKNEQIKKEKRRSSGTSKNYDDSDDECTPSNSYHNSSESNSSSASYNSLNNVNIEMMPKQQPQQSILKTPSKSKIPSLENLKDESITDRSEYTIKKPNVNQEEDYMTPRSNKSDTNSKNSNLNSGNENINDQLSLLKYELKEKDLDIVQLQKEINELQLDNKMLKARIPLASLAEENGISYDSENDQEHSELNNRYFEECRVLRREKECALEELYKAQDIISRMKIEKNNKSIDLYDPNNPEILQKKLKHYEKQIHELEDENEKHVNELSKLEKSLSSTRMENNDLKSLAGEARIYKEREDGLILEIANLKNEMSKCVYSNEQLNEDNQRLAELIKNRPPTPEPFKGISVAVQTLQAQQPEHNYGSSDDSNEGINRKIYQQQQQHLLQQQQNLQQQQQHFNSGRTVSQTINPYEYYYQQNKSQPTSSNVYPSHSGSPKNHLASNSKICSICNEPQLIEHGLNKTSQTYTVAERKPVTLTNSYDGKQHMANQQQQYEHEVPSEPNSYMNGYRLTEKTLSTASEQHNGPLSFPRDSRRGSTHSSTYSSSYQQNDRQPENYRDNYSLSRNDDYLISNFRPFTGSISSNSNSYRQNQGYHGQQQQPTVSTASNSSRGYQQQSSAYQNALSQRSTHSMHTGNSQAQNSYSMNSPSQAGSSYNLTSLQRQREMDTSNSPFHSKLKHDDQRPTLSTSSNSNANVRGSLPTSRFSNFLNNSYSRSNSIVNINNSSNYKSSNSLKMDHNDYNNNSINSRHDEPQESYHNASRRDSNASQHSTSSHHHHHLNPPPTSKPFFSSSETILNGEDTDTHSTGQQHFQNSDFDDKKSISSHKSLKINVMRDLKCAQKLKTAYSKTPEPAYERKNSVHNIFNIPDPSHEIEHSSKENGRRMSIGAKSAVELPIGKVKRSQTFSAATLPRNYSVGRSRASILNDQSVFDCDGTDNLNESSPAGSQFSLYNDSSKPVIGDQDDDDYDLGRSYYRSKSVDRTSFERKNLKSFTEKDDLKSSIAANDLARKRPFVPLKADDIRLGNYIKFSRPGGKISKGSVKYIGPLPERGDVYFGLELDSEEGKHDGIYQDKRYFQTKPNKGVFVSFSKVVMAWG